jgi:hypothetical protein
MSKATITATTALAVALTLLLSGCSSSKTTETATQESATPQPSCSESEIDGGSAWIKGQLAAFSSQDFESAYGFATESFRSGRSLEQFISIISSGYGFLLNSRTYSVGECIKEGDNFLFDVRVTAESGTEFPMMYALAKSENTWGINAATVVAEQLEEESETPIV